MIPAPTIRRVPVLASFLALPAALLGTTVSGVVEDTAGKAVPNARITLFTQDLETFIEARTDTAGRYTIDRAPGGMYRLGAAALDLEYTEVEVTVSGSSIERDFTLGPETHPGRWRVVGTTAPEFFDATDIGILTAGGQVFYCHDTMDPIVFDPASGEKTFPPSSGSAQGCMNGTLLAGGRVLLAGGQDGEDPGSFRNAVRWVKSYSLAERRWERLPDLQHPTGRWYPGLARLADGTLLIMGGGTRPSAQRTATCELLDPASGRSAYTGSMLNPSEFSPGALLTTGEVLATWWPPQLYDPSSGEWRQTGGFNQTDRGWPGHSDHSLVVLEDGRALAVGIRAGAGGGGVMGEVYDPASESWSLTSNPELVRFQAEVVQLPDGRVLAAGGETESASPPVPSTLGVVKWCDLYDPRRDRWRRVADMLHFREYHAVTLLVPDGRVLTTGGTWIKFRAGPTSADIEAFEPPYLFRGVRPEVRALSATELPRGGPVSLEVFPDTRLTSIVLMGTPATTHWVDGGIPRRVVLGVEQSGRIARAVLPREPPVLPLGHYLLFAMVDDIPSVARIVEVVEALPEAAFRRGDTSGNGTFDIADPIATLRFLFARGAVPGCLDASDSNDDGALDVSDPVHGLIFLFRGGPPPPAPGPRECGRDPSDDGLAGASYPACAG